MIPLRPKPAHVLFLFSDTGGGHRSAAEAIIEAIKLDFPGQISTEMVDIFKDYAPRPLDLAPAIYPPLSRLPDVWGWGYHLSNGKRRTRMVTNLVWPYVRSSLRQLVRERPCDLIVSVHPLANTPVLRALGEKRPPFITVVTDIVSTHAFWYNRKADLVVVPTQTACDRGIEVGLAPCQVKVVGLPVARRFCQPPGDRAELKRRLGWPDDRPVVLLIGGGEGMGPLEKTAYAIDESGLELTLVTIAGRNRKLKRSLDNHAWHIPALTYGFVHDMPDFMRAADMLVTKAGSLTISEAFIANLPIILYTRLPGQEEGNLEYVVEEGAGVWAPQPGQVVAALQNWLDNPAARARAAAACQRLARPNASADVARLIAGQLRLTVPVSPSLRIADSF